MKTMTLDGRIVCLHEKGKDGSILLHCVHGDGTQDNQRMTQLLARYAPGLAYTLVTVGCEDWNRDYSPWKAEIPGREPFEGGADKTLAFLRDRLLPEIRQDRDLPCAVGGYSLAGLFAVWAFYETDLFAGAAGCSPSLWFPGWDCQKKKAAGRGILYLSVGSKEELTRNAVMASVGDRLRSQYAQAQEDPGVLERELVFHPGGHGSQGDVRMAQGLSWLLRHL